MMRAPDVAAFLRLTARRLRSVGDVHRRWLVVAGAAGCAAPGRGRVSFDENDILVVSCRANRPASEDGLQLGAVKRPRILTVRIAREPADRWGAVEEPGRR